MLFIMKQVADINKSKGGTIIIPEPSAPGVLPQHPEASEYGGIAFLVTPAGELLDPDVARSSAPETPRWLIACTKVGDQPIIYRVEYVYLVLSMSDAFQLASKRTGMSVQVARLATPGRGDFGDTEFANQVSIVNVHYDDFQSVLNTPCIFRPAYDRAGDGGSPVSAWSFDIPETEPDAQLSGYLKWTDDEGVQKWISVARTARTGFSTTGHGDLLHQLIYGDFAGKGCNATLWFSIPIGFNFFTPDIPQIQPTRQLVWMTWYKQTGSQLHIGLTDEAHFSDPDQRNYVNNTSLLYPTLYYVGSLDSSAGA